MPNAPIDLDAAVAAQKLESKAAAATSPKPKYNGHAANGHAPHDDVHAANGADPATHHEDADSLFLRMDELKDETSLPPGDRRTIWLVEHAAAVDALTHLGVFATTYNRSMGWTADHGIALQGSDVVISFDRGHEKHSGTIASALHDRASRLKVVDWAACWPACPRGQGIAEWIEGGAGSAAKLFAFVDRLPAWAPPPFKSQFGAVPWCDLDKPRAPYEWLIKGFLPAHETTLVYGETQTGKSFMTKDLALSVARGIPWFGMKTRQCGVIYCAFEAGKGFPHRVNGYRLHHGLSIDDNIPFVCLTRRVNLFSDEEAIKGLKSEIAYWASTFSVPLGLLVFDTVSASSTGMKENLGEEFGTYIEHARSIGTAFNAAEILIHHKPKGGESPRGSGKLEGDLETTIDVKFDPSGEKDGHGRPVRMARVMKQREGESGKEVRFILGQIETGRDEDNSAVTTCIVLPMDGTVQSEQRRQGYTINPLEASFFKALLTALNKYGRLYPEVAEVPTDMRAVAYDEVKRIYVELNPWDVPADEKDNADEIRKKHFNMLKTRLHRCRTALSHPKANVIGANKDIMWWTGRSVKGFPETQPKVLSPKKAEPLPEDIGDLIG